MSSIGMHKLADVIFVITALYYIIKLGQGIFPNLYWNLRATGH